MISIVGTMLCFVFRAFHELESYLYEGMCLNENAKESDHGHGLHGIAHRFAHGYNKSSEHHFTVKSLLLLWLPIFTIGLLTLLYGMYRFTRFSTKSLFGSVLTAESVAKDVNLTGKVVIVTGASDGMGKETTRVLLKQGACVVMAVRDREKGDETRRYIIDDLTSKDILPLQTLEKRINMLTLDLSSLQSVRDFVINFNKLGLPLHYLINNGGIMATENYELSKDGLENQFEINYLSHYYLTRLLTPNLLQTPNSRVINLTSVAYYSAPKPFDEWLNKHLMTGQGPTKDEYSNQGFTEYAISKAGLLLFAKEYQKRYPQILSLSVHPGDVDTKLWNRNTWLKRFRCSIVKFFKFFPGEFKSVEQGSATIVYGVVTSSDQIKPGGYYRDCTFADDDLRKDIIATGNDAKLWDLSERLIKKAGYEFTL